MAASRFDALNAVAPEGVTAVGLQRFAVLLTHRYARHPLVVREGRLAWVVYPSRFVADGQCIRVLGSREAHYGDPAGSEQEVFQGCWSWRRLCEPTGQGYAHLCINGRLGEHVARCLDTGVDDQGLERAARGYECWGRASFNVPGDHCRPTVARDAVERLRAMWREQSPTERSLSFYFLNRIDRFVRWPLFDFVLAPVSRARVMHDYPESVVELARQASVKLDRRRNGPAIAAYELAGGERPVRRSGHGWSIHHLYDGQFPLHPGGKVLRAVVSPEHFSQSAGLVAIHPAADGLAAESPFFACWLRWMTFHRFHYDPDGVFTATGRKYCS